MKKRVDGPANNNSRIILEKKCQVTCDKDEKGLRADDHPSTTVGHSEGKSNCPSEPTLLQTSD